MGIKRILTCGLYPSKRRQTSIEGFSTISYAKTEINGNSQDSVGTQSSISKEKLEIVTTSTRPASDDTEVRTNRALIVASKRVYDIVEEAFPVLHNDDEVIISSRAVGLNPIDWKSVDYNFCLPEFPWITGREMAGVVERIGANVKDFKVGDRVWTSTYYRDRRAGCFQHYVSVPQHTVCHIPANLDFDSAACLGVAGLTAAMTLWKWLEVPISPSSKVESILERGYLLIWGGSAVTAQFAIQIAVRSGLKVVAVTSAKTKPLVENLGATFVVVRDGKTNDEIVSEIRAIGGDSITKAIDLVGTQTAEYCLKALSTTSPCLFAPLAMISSKTEIPSNISVQTVEMKKFVLEPGSKVYSTELNRLIQGGNITLPQIEVTKGGLDAVQAGLERLKDGDMAGKKLVVSFAG